MQEKLQAYILGIIMKNRLKKCLMRCKSNSYIFVTRRAGDVFDTVRDLY